MSTWTSDELDRIAGAEELELASVRRDGTLRKPVTIWVVRHDDDVYVRSVNGRISSWFRGAQAQHEAHIRAGGVDVLEPDFAVGDQPPGVVGDVDPPQLLGAALVERHRVDGHGPGGEGPEEVGGVGEPDGELAPVLDGGAGADAGRPFDGGAVQTALHDAPGGEVLGAELDVTGDPRS